MYLYSYGPPTIVAAEGVSCTELVEQGPPVVRMNGVSKVYNEYSNVVHALQSVSLEVNDGDFVAITGPSGSGKSTLLNIMGCLDRPSSGKVMIDGRDTAAMSDRDLSILRGRKIGFVFQGSNIIPHLTVLENVMLPGILQKRPMAKLRERATQLLELTGIVHRATHKGIHLSGGEQQRVAIARALINDPVMILADEPTGALDSVGAGELMRLLVGLNKQRHITTVMVTHESKLASYAQRSIQLRDGQVMHGPNIGW